MVDSVAALPNVKVWKSKAESVLPELKAAGPYLAICCDANIDYDQAIEILAPLFPLLTPG